MRILHRDSKLVRLDRLTPHPQNPRRGSAELIQRVIEANGWWGGLVVQRSTGHILVGNHRYEAARLAGAKEVPVFYVDVDDQRALAIMLADNRATDLASYDHGELDALLRSMDADLLASIGYDAFDVPALEEEGGTADTAPQLTGALEYRVVITCSSEAQQLTLLARLTSEGFVCQALIS